MKNCFSFIMKIEKIKYSIRNGIKCSFFILSNNSFFIICKYNNFMFNNCCFFRYLNNYFAHVWKTVSVLVKIMILLNFLLKVFPVKIVIALIFQNLLPFVVEIIALVMFKHSFFVSINRTVYQKWSKKQFFKLE